MRWPTWRANSASNSPTNSARRFSQDSSAATWLVNNPNQPQSQWQLTMTAGAWQQFVAVNSSVNRSVRYTEDGPANTWQLPRFIGTGPLNAWHIAGDCEDYVIQKRIELMWRGFDPRALRPVLCRADGDLHSVSLAITDHGDYILDQFRYLEVAPWRDVGYTWIWRLGPALNTVKYFAIG